MCQSGSKCTHLPVKIHTLGEDADQVDAIVTVVSHGWSVPQWLTRFKTAKWQAEMPPVDIISECTGFAFAKLNSGDDVCGSCVHHHQQSCLCESKFFCEQNSAASGVTCLKQHFSNWQNSQTGKAKRQRNTAVKKRYFYYREYKMF